MTHARLHCANERRCEEDDILNTDHLRVNLSPPGKPWKQLRFCDAICLAQWLEDEIGHEHKSDVFVTEDMIDSRINDG